KVDTILLDNMSISQIKKSVAIRGKARVLLEVSGGVNLANVRQIAKAGP
ncbi:MAG: nicotinate-nucleotide diphosphorylase (carboxylating), partial [Candidatus Omnitrophica bacterium CG10_big_fil_rev_8_21_14_0_10_43_8]